MRKTVFILCLFALIASSCGDKKAPFDYTTLPSEWRELSEINGKFVACDDPFEVLKIEGNRLFRHYFARGEQSDSEYEILESYQTGDTVVISIKPTDGQEWTRDFKIIWIDKDKGVAKWIFNDEGGAVTFVVNENALEFPNIKCFDDKSQRKVKHLYRATGNNYICFDDGTAFEETEDRGDGYDYLIASGKIDPENPGEIETNATYREFPTCLKFNGTNYEWKFFDDLGHIDWGWKIINHYRIYSLFQITNLETETAKIPAKEIQAINETCLIFIMPENLYEEWAWYEDDRKKEFAAMGIQAVDAQKRYLSFALYDNDKIIVDTKKEQNGKICCALLYRKGYIPIMISISGESEEGMEHIATYLSESGDGYPPFERWSTLEGE